MSKEILNHMMNYPNPNFYNPYQPVSYNPYFDRVQQFQQMNQNINANNQQTINPMIKIVDSIDAVKANDIPIDGNMYYFPKADGTEIYAKRWMPNGTTQILSFKPVYDNDMENVSSKEEKSKFDLSDKSTDAFMKRFDDIEMKIMEFDETLSKSLSKLSDIDKKGADNK